MNDRENRSRFNTYKFSVKVIIMAVVSKIMWSVSSGILRTFLWIRNGNEDTNTKKIHIATRCDSVKNMSERNVAHNKRSDIIKWRVVNERVGVERQIADWPIDVAFFVYVMNIVLKKSQKVVTNHLENCLKFLTIKHFYGFALIVCRNVDALDLISITLKKRAHKNVIVCEP